MRAHVLIPALALSSSLLALPPTGYGLPWIGTWPERPTTADSIRIAVYVLEQFDPALHFVGVQDRRIVFQYAPEAPLPEEPFYIWIADINVGPLQAGVYSIDVMADGDITFQSTIEVAGSSPQLVLQESQDGDFAFNVSVEYEPPVGSGFSGTGQGIKLTENSGFFWFFDPGNVEVTVKILDGRGVNGKYWVFLSSMTDVKFTATVSQCPANLELPIPCVEKVYQSTQGVNRNIIDVNFPGH